MKLLHVLSQIQITGAETYAISLAEQLENTGHKIVFASDTLSHSNGFKFIPVPLHARNTSYVGRLRNLQAIKDLIKSESIDLIHSHSRAANLISHFASHSWSKKYPPLVTTVHGWWRNTFAFRNLPCLGQKTIAICPSVHRYLVEQIGISYERVLTIPNGVDTKRHHPLGDKNMDEPEILFVGRFSGQKGKVFRFLMDHIYPEVLKNTKNVRFKVFSSNPSETDLDNIAKFNSKFNQNKITLADVQESLPQAYRSAAIVIGSGRVILEAMSSGTPTIAIGESSAPGLVHPESLEQAFDSNFGDCGEWDLFEENQNLVQDIKTILSQKQRYTELARWSRDTVLNRFDSTVTSKQIEDVYKGVMESTTA